MGGAPALTTPTGSTRAVSPAAPMVHSPPANPRLAGVDGCPGGWVLATVDQGGKIDVSVVSEFSRVIRLVKEGQLTRAIVDIPIGLPDAEHRKANVEARRLLGKRAVCVFPAPRRETLLAGSHEEASDVRERIDGKRMAKQSFNIMPKIREVDELLDAPLQKTIHEGHPEVTFCLLNGGEPVMQSKDTPEGRTKRLQLLTAAFADLGVELEALPAKPQGASMDDVIDALALLVSALRAEKGLAKTIPEKPEYDRRGLRAEVVA